MSDGVTAPDPARDPDRADAEALLNPGERLLWFWNPTAGRRWGACGDALLALALIALLASLSVSLWFDHDLTLREERRHTAAAVASAIALLVVLWRLAGWHRGADELETWFGATVPARAYGLTQHRLLMLSRTLRWQVPLEPGKPIIQYGGFRIDRPDRRGQRLIRRIPKAEQHRLFAALQLARAIREGRVPVPA